MLFQFTDIVIKFAQFGADPEPDQGPGQGPGRMGTFQIIWKTQAPRQMYLQISMM